MIVANDLRSEAGSLELGTQVIFDESGFFRSLHHHAGVVIRIQRLVLRGDGVDRDALGLHSLDVFDKIPGVGIIVSRIEAASFKTVVGFYPGGSRPWCGEELY